MTERSTITIGSSPLVPESVKDNSDLVHYMMNFSNYGGVTQAFIIEAIRLYSEKVKSAPVQADKPGQFVSNMLWRKIAEEVHGKLEFFHSRG